MDYKLEYKPVGFGTDPVTNEENHGLSGTFFIPAYQRGYRWTRDDVNKLLDDILESAKAKALRYSLQPIVVKKRGENDWELIDGQQRLTTLWLIFNYMHKGGYRRSGAAYNLEYETRASSHSYLQTLDVQQASENIDYFHLRAAHEAITAWFEANTNNEQAKENRILQIYGYLSNSVRVIWYEVPKTEEPIPLFTRLNQGRIPLTDAELLKAVLLTHVAKEHKGREAEIAAQWDGMERDLQRPEVWSFVAGNTHNDTPYSTRISLLFDTLAQPKNSADDKLRPPPKPFQTFDTLREQVEKDGLKFWEKVEALHAQILGWRDEPRWYNKIGFLVACGVSIGTIQEQALDCSKQAFDSWLDEKIKTTLNIKADGLEKLSYETRPGTLQRALLLFNILICRDRFPFEKHMGQAWTLEHIHAQNAQDLTRVDQWRAWLQEHLKALQAIETIDNAAKLLLDEVNTAIEAVEERGFGERFRNLAGRIQKALTPHDEGADHSIANLALLSHKVNAELSNAVFEVKRQKVVKRDQGGHYIPAATRNVFLKYYTRANHQQVHFWGTADKSDYLQEIQTTLKPYLQ